MVPFTLTLSASTVLSVTEGNTSLPCVTSMYIHTDTCSPSSGALTPSR